MHRNRDIQKRIKLHRVVFALEKQITNFRRLSWAGIKSKKLIPRKNPTESEKRSSIDTQPEFKLLQQGERPTQATRTRRHLGKEERLEQSAALCRTSPTKRAKFNV